MRRTRRERCFRAGMAGPLIGVLVPIGTAAGVGTTAPARDTTAFAGQVTKAGSP